jgi:hypothetical protein
MLLSDCASFDFQLCYCAPDEVMRKHRNDFIFGIVDVKGSSHGGKRIVDFLRLCKDYFTSFDFFFHKRTNHIVRDVRAFVVEELASGTE